MLIFKKKFLQEDVSDILENMENILCCLPFDADRNRGQNYIAGALFFFFFSTG